MNPEVVPIEWVFADEADDYRAYSPVTIRRMVSPSYEGVRYAVRRATACLSVEGRWEYEPSPSRRTDEFYDAFRFRTFADAVAAARKARGA
jgi:hypothetical protein